MIQQQNSNNPQAENTQPIVLNFVNNSLESNSQSFHQHVVVINSPSGALGRRDGALQSQIQVVQLAGTPSQISSQKHSQFCNNQQNTVGGLQNQSNQNLSNTSQGQFLNLPRQTRNQSQVVDDQNLQFIQRGLSGNYTFYLEPQPQKSPNPNLTQNSSANLSQHSYFNYLRQASEEQKVADPINQVDGHSLPQQLQNQLINQIQVQNQGLDQPIVNTVIFSSIFNIPQPLSSPQTCKHNQVIQGPQPSGVQLQHQPNPLSNQNQQIISQILINSQNQPHFQANGSQPVFYHH